MMRNHVLRELTKLHSNWSPKVIFDVGANVGQSVEEFRQCYPDSHIYAFEPISATFQSLVANVESDPLVLPNNIALGASVSIANMTSRGVSTGNKIVAENLSGDGIESVRVSTGDLFCHQQGIDRIGFLKIDAEGYDLRVLVGFAQMLREGRVDILQAEVGLAPENKVHVPFRAMTEFLEPFGYRFYRLSGVVAVDRVRPPRIAPALYADAVYLRPNAESIVT